jgi:PiT family inorganic phosphate transporter
MLTFSFEFLVIVVIAALVFDFINGFHDAANSIATVVSTRVLSPGLAVIWAAFFNFVAAFVFPLTVAKTIGKGLIAPDAVSVQVIFAGLVGGIVWDLLTWYWGLPTSSSHALIGGYAGAAIASAGFSVVIVGGWTKTLVSMFLSPVVGLVLGVLMMIAVSWLFRSRSPARVDRFFRRGQLVSAGLYSLGHGGNDAQKTMGIIAILVYTYKKTHGLAPTDVHIEYWMVVACGAAIALGTMAGGWRIVKTMGSKITKLKPVGGFCAETAAAVTLFANSYLGIPVSTTHTITGAIAGVGATQRLSAVRWGVATRIVWAWVLTIPGSAAIAALAYAFLKLIGA